MAIRAQGPNPLPLLASPPFCLAFVSTHPSSSCVYLLERLRRSSRRAVAHRFSRCFQETVKTNTLDSHRHDCCLFVLASLSLARTLQPRCPALRPPPVPCFAACVQSCGAPHFSSRVPLQCKGLSSCTKLILVPCACTCSELLFSCMSFCSL